MWREGEMAKDRTGLGHLHESEPTHTERGREDTQQRITKKVWGGEESEPAKEGRQGHPHERKPTDAKRRRGTPDKPKGKVWEERGEKEPAKDEDGRTSPTRRRSRHMEGPEETPTGRLERGGAQRERDTRRAHRRRPTHGGQKIPTRRRRKRWEGQEEKGNRSAGIDLGHPQEEQASK